MEPGVVLVTLALLGASRVLAAQDLTEVLGTLARQIVLKYLMDLPKRNLCLGIVTEDTTELLDYLLPLDIPTHVILLSRDELLHSKRLGNHLLRGSNSVAYGTRRFNAAFTRALQ